MLYSTTGVVYSGHLYTMCWADAMVAIAMPAVIITTATYFDIEYLREIE